MGTSDYPKDDNLRLILSVGHEEWLQGKIAKTRRLILLFSVVLILGIGWMAGVVTHATEPRNEEPPCISLKEGGLLKELIRDGSVPPGTTLCPAENTAPDITGGERNWQETIVDAALLLLTVLAVIMILYSAIDIFQSLRKLKGYRLYLLDHREFMNKYNRL
ncbi:MAG: hypothetical protein ISR48_03510 [Alphaproteobacteria bacterium]|nr:hypothetical protein [Alphaproteobacteria bacterium]